MNKKIQREQIAFETIIAPHFHVLVNTMEDISPNRILLHEWVLGIERNWIGISHANPINSDYIGRLHFWMGGLREKFQNHLSNNELKKLLIDTFDASTFCYFEYNADERLLNIIETYAKKIDAYYQRKLLLPKYVRFISTAKVIPIIESYVRIIDSYQTNVSVKKTDFLTAKEPEILEKKFLQTFRNIIDAFIDISQKDGIYKKDIEWHLNSFLQEIKQIGYENIITQEQKESISQLHSEITKEQRKQKLQPPSEKFELKISVRRFFLKAKNIRVILTKSERFIDEKETNILGVASFTFTEPGEYEITALLKNKQKTKAIEIFKPETRVSIHLFL